MSFLELMGLALVGTAFLLAAIAFIGWPIGSYRRRHSQDERRLVAFFHGRPGNRL